MNARSCTRPFGGARSRSAAVATLALALGAGIPVPGAAQDLGTDCDLVQFRVIERQETRPGAQITWIGRPVLDCPDGLRIRADSAVVFQETGRNELIGNVVFTSPGRELRSRAADYWEREDRLHAYGAAVFRDDERGSEVRGDTLILLQEGPRRPEDNVNVYGGRPSAILRPGDRPTADDPAGDPPEPYHVTANRLRFQGDRFFWADGAVEVERGELQASADSLAFNREAGDLILTVDARAERGGLRAEGHRLNLGIADERLSTVRARESGRIVSDDFELTGEDIQVELNEDEEVESVVAEGGEERASLASDEILLVGDRIEIEEASGDDRIIRGIGRARAETRSRDAPRIEADGLVLDRDYVEGDEIVGTLVRVAPAQELAAEEPDEPDPVPEPDAPALAPEPEERRPEYRLETLEATGNATSFYRSPPEEQDEPEPEGAPPADPDDPDDPDAPGDPSETELDPRLWAISYVQADRIVISLADGEVQTIEAEMRDGRPVTGVQLQPRNQPDPGRTGTGPAATSSGAGR